MKWVVWRVRYPIREARMPSSLNDRLAEGGCSGRRNRRHFAGVQDQIGPAGLERADPRAGPAHERLRRRAVAAPPFCGPAALARRLACVQRRTAPKGRNAKLCIATRCCRWAPRNAGGKADVDDPHLKARTANLDDCSARLQCNDCRAMIATVRPTYQH